MELILDAVKYTAEQIRRFEQKKKKTVNQNFKFKVAWCSWIQNSVYIHEDSLQSRKIYDLQGAQPVKRFLSSSQGKRSLNMLFLIIFSQRLVYAG